jgi:cellulose synthase/poly-beta-1,6-N-acetylglucosamine synthase-like glycosyltransferase
VIVILTAAVFWMAVILVVHTYVGYPLGICLRARRSGRQSTERLSEEDLPSVTVLIPAYNEGKWIGRKIENTLALDYPRDRLQILVASDGCTDETTEVAAQYASCGVELDHHATRCGKTATVNRAVPAARADVILLTDCNALLPADTLRLLVPYFKDESVGSVSGEKVCVPTDSVATEGEGLYWKYESAIKTAESRLGSALGGTGQVMAVRRSFFPEIPVIGDDFYVPMKILLSTGGRSLFEPRAKAAIPAAATLRLELERKTRAHVSLLCDLPYLKEGLYPWKSEIWWRFLSHHVLRLFVPFGMMAAFVSACALWNAGLLYKVMVLGQGAFYAAALAGWVLAAVNIRVAVVYVPFYFVLANVAVLKSWARWMRGKQQYAWQRTERLLPDSRRRQQGYGATRR